MDFRHYSKTELGLILILSLLPFSGVCYLGARGTLMVPKQMGFPLCVPSLLGKKNTTALSNGM